MVKRWTCNPGIAGSIPRSITDRTNSLSDETLKTEVPCMMLYIEHVKEPGVLLELGHLLYHALS